MASWVQTKVKPIIPSPIWRTGSPVGGQPAGLKSLRMFGGHESVLPSIAEFPNRFLSRAASFSVYLAGASPTRLRSNTHGPQGRSIPSGPVRGGRGSFMYARREEPQSCSSRREAYERVDEVSIPNRRPHSRFRTALGAASRTAVSNGQPTRSEKLRPRAGRVNLSRYPRRLSRGYCRVPRQPRRPVAGTSAFLSA